MKELLRLLMKSLPKDFSFTIERIETEIKVKIVHKRKSGELIYNQGRIIHLQNWIIAKDIQDLIKSLKPQKDA